MNACLRPSLLLVMLVWLSVTGPGTARPPWPSASGSGNNDRSQRPHGRNHPCHGGHGREQRARLRKVLLGNGTAVCNDGSPAGAGGAGVLLNVDRIADLLASLHSKVKVRGVVDSGWFLDNEPFEARECLEPYSCAPVETIKRGIRLWNGQVPDRCKPLYSDYEQWRCYFGYRIYPTLKAPTFVFQWVFDEAQMVVNNVAAPSSKAHWDYIHALGSKLRSTLMNVTALFAPSCISHEILTKRNWQAIEICGISLPQALRCWELQKHEHNHHEHHSNHNLYDRLPAKENETRTYFLLLLYSFRHRMFADVSATVMTNGHAQKTKTRRRKMKRRRKNCRHNRKGLRKARKGEYSATSAPLRSEEPRRRSRERPGSRHAQHRWRLHEDLCQHWLMDSCAWPQCNRRCPRMLDPMTGRELRFSDLLRSFGLDVAAVAAALGLDQAALAAMEPDALLHAD
ncbi:hypothetical protein HPB52_010985 [Rhipicephalus sanguineus]|uniref:Uncharacterized protein n=1 Tax=Rhipicephalus sanguineus TaxID=34632 RepID=A0A9D4SSX4_RHISA|nr:hypothetical protein HPB52_010985 [Rhipicephalus sanguineus]